MGPVLEIIAALALSPLILFGGRIGAGVYFTLLVLFVYRHVVAEALPGEQAQRRRAAADGADHGAVALTKGADEWQSTLESHKKSRGG